MTEREERIGGDPFVLRCLIRALMDLEPVDPVRTKCVDLLEAVGMAWRESDDVVMGELGIEELVAAVAAGEMWSRGDDGDGQ